jgi:hypothetical protein
MRPIHLDIKTNGALRKTMSLYWVAYGAFVLGGYNVDFTGSKWAWIALACSAVLVLVSSCSLLCDFWTR